MSSKKDELMKKALASSKKTQVISEGTNTLFNFKATEISIEKITVEEQVRKEFDPEYIKELAQSIREIGLIQPITVRSEQDHYRLITGECRLRAFKELRRATIPAIIRKVEDDAILIEQITENVTRSDINPFEEAEGYDRLIKEYGFSHQMIADKTGKSKTRITKTISLLALAHHPSLIGATSHRLNLSRGHLEDLVSVVKEPFFENLLNEINENISVKELREKIKKLKSALIKGEDGLGGIQKPPSGHAGITLTLDDKHERLKLIVTWENDSEKAIIEDFKRELQEVVSAKATEFRRRHEAVSLKLNITTRVSGSKESVSEGLASSSTSSLSSSLASSLNKNEILDLIKSKLDVEIDKIKDFDKDFLLDQFNALPFRKPKDPSAVFFKSVLGKWKLPSAYLNTLNNSKDNHRDDNLDSFRDRSILSLKEKINKYKNYLSTTNGLDLDDVELKRRKQIERELPDLISELETFEKVC